MRRRRRLCAQGDAVQCSAVPRHAVSIAAGATFLPALPLLLCSDWSVDERCTLLRLLCSQCEESPQLHDTLHGDEDDVRAKRKEVAGLKAEVKRLQAEMAAAALPPQQQQLQPGGVAAGAPPPQQQEARRGATHRGCSPGRPRSRSKGGCRDRSSLGGTTNRRRDYALT